MKHFENFYKPVQMGAGVSRILYIGMMLLGGYFIWSGDLGTGLSNFGIALVFDPFNPTVTWNNRPAYQKIWLYIHLGIVFFLMGRVLFRIF
ncbi:MAG TPA: hypothetical protein PKJ63_00725 [Cyclobacteriaceae bacterium]|nr:hypothetical protein [Cyclobacteriaceae bacterium]